MKKPSVLTATLLIAALTSTSVYASATTFGAYDCGQWTRTQSAVSKAWLLGYLSGVNMMVNKGNPLGELSSAEQAYAWTDKFCQENPLKGVADAADALMIELAIKVGRKR